MAESSADYEGRLIAGHVLWVRDAENGGKWIPIVGMKGEQGQKGGVYVPQWDGRYLTFKYNSTSDGNPSPIELDLKGPQGERGPEGPQGKQGVRGPQGEKGAPGEDGDGAFELAVQAGYEGTARAFYDALAAVVATGETAQEAIELAKKNNHAHLFETQEEHDLWLADPQMTNTLNIGDLLFVKETTALSIWDGDNEIGFPSTATLDLHIKDKDNPHEVRAEQVPYEETYKKKTYAHGDGSSIEAVGFSLYDETLVGISLSKITLRYMGQEPFSDSKDDPTVLVVKNGDEKRTAEVVFDDGGFNQGYLIFTFDSPLVITDNRLEGFFHLKSKQSGKDFAYRYLPVVCFPTSEVGVSYSGVAVPKTISPAGIIEYDINYASLPYILLEFESGHKSVKDALDELYDGVGDETYTKEETDAKIAEHAERKDNPHEVTAGQVACDEAETALAKIDGADNWGEAWGFDLDLRSINPDVWEGRADGTVAKVTTVGLQVNGSSGKNVQAKLEITGTDGTVWTSTNAASWNSSGAGVDYTFNPPASLPNGVMKARFLNTSGNAINVPMRISKVSTTETPAGCDVWTAENGASKRTDFAPRVRATTYEVPMTVADALAGKATQDDLKSRLFAQGIAADDGYTAFSGDLNTLTRGGLYYCNSMNACSNTPFDSMQWSMKPDFLLLVRENAGDAARHWTYQLCIPLCPDRDDAMYRRIYARNYTDNGWLEWRTIAVDETLVQGIVDEHNEDVEAHKDIRDLLIDFGTVFIFPSAIQTEDAHVFTIYGGDKDAYTMSIARGQDQTDSAVSIFISDKTTGVNTTDILPTKPYVDNALAKKQDKLAAGDNVTLTPQADGTVKIEATGGGSTVSVDTTIPEAPADDHVPSTKLVKTELDKKVDKDGAEVSGTLNIKPLAQSTSTTVATLTVKGETFYRPQLGTAQVINTDLTISFTNYLGETGITFGSIDGKDFGTGLTARAFYASEIKDGDSQPTSSWLAPDYIYEKGQKLSDKYAAKADTYTKAEVDEKSGVKGIVDEGFTWESGGKIFSFGYTGREGESIWSRDLRFIKQSESLSIHAVTYINETEAVNDEIFENSVPLMSTFQALQDRVTALEEEVEALKQAGVPTVDPNAAPTMTSLYDLNTKENDVIQSLGQFYVEGTNLTWNVDAEDEGFFVIYNTAETACDVVMANDDPTRVIIVNRCEFVSDDEEIELVFRKRIKLEGMDNALISVKYPKPLKTRIPEA